MKTGMTYIFRQSLPGSIVSRLIMGIRFDTQLDEVIEIICLIVSDYRIVWAHGFGGAYNSLAPAKQMESGSVLNG
jgi:hypothetical protein